ncbi:MAG: hypothetical protein KatS3mg057_1482 [Herpetosiphonaceae bacterium]|nr:MAG: hypothetical protein KatS3mg057_1482 [Herpetosiphonaceae bacterium]
MSEVTQAGRLPKTSTEKTSRRGDLRRVVALLNRFMKGQRGVFLLALVMLISEAITAIAAKYPLAYLIDYLQGRKPDLLANLGPLADLSPRFVTIGALTGAMILLALSNSSADSFAEIFLSRGGRLLGYRLRSALYAHLQKLSLAFYSKQRTGDLLTRVTSDVTAVEDFAINSLKDIAASIYLLVLTVATLLLVSWQIALVTVVMVPLLSLVSNYFAERIQQAAKQQRAREGELAAAAQEMLTSIRVIQAYGSAGNEQQRFAEQSQRTMDVALTAARLQAWFSGVINVLQSVAVVIVVWAGVWLIGGGALSIGTLVFSIGLIVDMFKPTKRIIKEFNRVGKIIASVERIGEVLDRKPAVEDAPDAVPAPPFKGEIAFRHVSFAYRPDPEDVEREGAGTAPPRLALHNVNFTVSAGEVIALVGSSGAGKSTILQLLPRLYDPHEGQVLIDGHDIRSFTLDSLRAQISTVLQETILFTGTVAENIAYGRPDATREEIVAAAMQANAHEFIEKLPQGYDTPLSERAANLSGGQRQRIAIARAFIRNTPILLLDEPTTGLDAESSDLVRLALQTLMKGKSTMIVSHDLNLIRHADRIIVIDAGQIVETGTHRELLSAGGLYAHLYFKQFGQSEVNQELAPTQPDLRQAEEDEPESIPRKAFETLLLEALPAPAAPKDFQTLIPRSAQSPPERGQQPTPVAGARPSSTVKWPDATRQQDEEHDPIFQTLLMQTLRRPEGSSPGRRTPARLSLSPLDSPELDRELPGLKTALDGDAMRAYFEKTFFDDWHQTARIRRCSPGKILYLPGDSCLVRYTLELEIDGADGPRAEKRLVCARVLPDREACLRYVRQRLAPLAQLARSREDLAPFVTPVGLIEPVNAIASVFPIDGDLPTLLGATEPGRMLDMFRQLLPEALDGRFIPSRCRIETVNYARRGHCTLRYVIDGETRSGAFRQITAYGKVWPDGRGARIAKVVEIVKEQVLARNDIHPFTVPRFLGYRPDLRLSLVEAVPGRPLIAELIKARSDRAESGHTLEELISLSAGIVAALHSTPTSFGSHRALDVDLADLHRGLPAIRRLSPELGAQLQSWLERIQSYAEISDRLSLCLSHGDFTPSQLLFADGSRSLIDFETFCQAEPALDLGRFLAYLRLSLCKAYGPAAFRRSEQLTEHFLKGYLAALGERRVDAELLRVRVSIYEVVSLLRVALHSWQQFKSDRLQLAIAVLEEELSCLPQVNY